MPLNTAELLDAAEMVAECRQMKVCLKGSALGAAITALTTFIGGIVGGPAGLVVGATGGSLASYSMMQGSFKPLSTVLREDLTTAQKDQLAKHISNAIKDYNITDIVGLLMLLQAKEYRLQALIADAIIKFVQKECCLSVTSSKV